MLVTELKSVKGQTWSTDILITSLVLTFILVFFLVGWNYLGYNWNNSEKQDKMYVAALFASEALISQAGDGWENKTNISGITTFGLVDQRNVLSNKKLENMNLANLTIIKEKLGIPHYNLYINITNGSVIFYEFGNSPSQLNETIKIERLALLNKTLVKVRLHIWD